jgi:hypothetical protein
MKMICCGSIIRQRNYIWEVILNVLKYSVAVAILFFVIWAIVSTLIGEPNYKTAYFIIAFGIILFLISFFTNIGHNSPVKLGVINRGEFYGVVAVIIGSFFYMNTRIDALFTLITQIR